MRQFERESTKTLSDWVQHTEQSRLSSESVMMSAKHQMTVKLMNEVQHAFHLIVYFCCVCIGTGVAACVKSIWF